ncbi:hypothetical protein TCAL_05230 [Tigriopus californicus]|uniref:UBC core domain-containing protein n=1 Tax=Tigriopus californicus TaxID=6832 RepID=A0A553NVX9_TIGCA|nr:hypothetical protein TCAL_05230 [Tigriopus californicus]
MAGVSNVSGDPGEAGEGGVPGGTCHFFYEDGVYRVGRHGQLQFGMIVENSEYYSSESEEEGEDAAAEAKADDPDDKLKPGTVRVAWHPKGHEQVVPETSEFNADVVVCYESWIGVIKSVNNKITLKLSDGSLCKLSEEFVDSLENLCEDRDEDCQFKGFEYFPGLVLKGPKSIYEKGEFLLKSPDYAKKAKFIRSTVIETEVESIGVHWQCKAYSKDEDGLSKLSAKLPDYTVPKSELKKVKKLYVFEPCTLQIGDRNFYTLKEDDRVVPLNEWIKKEQSIIQGRSGDPPPELPELPIVDPSGTDQAVVGTGVHESPSSGESDAESTSSETNKRTKKRNVISSKALYKKKAKVRKLKSKREKRKLPKVKALTPGEKYVVETIRTESVADVVWQDGTVEENVPSRELPIEMEASEEPVYDLKDHPDFRYRPSSIVIRVANFEPSQSKKGCGGQVLDNLTSGKVSVWSVIVGFEQVQVWWADDSVSECWPQDLYKIGEYDSDDEGGLWSGDADDWLNDDLEDGDESVSSWETLSETSEPGDVYAYIELNAEVEDDEDPANLRPKLAANIEKARIAMTRLEEIFQENPNLQTNCVMKQLLDVFIDCRYLDRLMGTSFFHENNFEGLLEKIRDRGKVGSYQQQVNAQMRRLFDRSPSNLKTMGVPTDKSGNASNLELASTSSTDAKDRESFNEENQPSQESVDQIAEKLSEASLLATNLVPTDINDDLDWVDDQQMCAKLCSLMKAQLVKAHDEVVERYGGQGAIFTQEDLKESPGEAEDDLEGIMIQILSSARESLNDKLAEISSVLGRCDEKCQKLEESQSSATDTEVAPPPPKGVSSQEIAQALYGTTTKSQLDTSKAASEILNTNEDDDGQGSEEVFSIEESAPGNHKFKLSLFQPIDPKNFIKFVRKEVNLLKTNLPEGIFVKAFEDRMDLYSVMIKGPQNTPYEDGLFFFDFQLTADYPKTPPVCHYISYCSDRLNPNLYEDGKVCVSLLGTWSGKGTETWSPNSNMLQLLVSIQGLILVSEPYFNEAGYERQKGSQQGTENSRMYNEMVVLKLIQSMTKLIQNPPPVFKSNVHEHFEKNGQRFITRVEEWLNQSLTHHEPNKGVREQPVGRKPDFPLIPTSKGFCISVSKAVSKFKEVLSQVKGDNSDSKPEQS